MRTIGTTDGWPTPPGSRGGQLLGNAFSAPELNPLTGSSLIRRPDGLFSLTDSQGGTFISNGSPISRAMTADGAYRHWSDQEDYQPIRPLTTSLAVRRLVPAMTNSPSRKVGLHDLSASEHACLSSVPEVGSRSLMGRPLAVQASPDRYLVCRSVSSPSSRKQRGEPSAAKQAPQKAYLTQMQAAVQQELLSQTSSEMDFQALAKESILWLDELPKQERISAMAEMKQWVKSSGLNWDLWWQYCQRARQEAARPQAGLTGPTFLGRPSGRPRELTQPEFNSVPPQMRAYHDRIKSRSNISRAQAHAVMNQQAAAQQPPGTSRPTSDEEWYHLATEALDWLGQKTKDERPAAMSQMRQWVVESGLNWDAWWGYCRRMQEFKKRAALERENPAMLFETDEQVVQTRDLPQDTPTSEASRPKSPEEDFHGRERRRAMTLPDDQLREAEKDEKDLEAEAKKERIRERKAREEARLAQNEIWEAQSQEKMLQEYNQQWKERIRSYTHEVLGEDEDGELPMTSKKSHGGKEKRRKSLDAAAKDT